MQDYQRSCDLPFSKSFQRKPINNYPLPYFYTQQTKEQSFDLPMQISHNPYNHNRKGQQNHPKYSKNNQSISKHAITQISNKDQQEYATDITPICQQLFGLDDDKFFQEFQLPKSSNDNEMITQATFKPNELHQYLHNQVNSKDNNRLKYLLENNVFNNNNKLTKKAQGKQNNSTRSNANLNQQRKITIRCNSQAKSKTKYERILEQYFKIPTKKHNLDDKINLLNIPYHKNYLEQVHHDQVLDQKMKKYRLLIQQFPQNKKVRSKTINHCKSERGLTLNNKTVNQKVLSNRLKKTMSQSRFNRANQQKQKKWLKMTFEQRQSKTLENRKQKQKTGKLNNLQKQIQNCTFKPQITFLKIHPKQIASGSYAKIYYQKVRKRLL